MKGKSLAICSRMLMLCLGIIPVAAYGLQGWQSTDYVKAISDMAVTLENVLGKDQVNALQAEYERIKTPLEHQGKRPWPF